MTHDTGESAGSFRDHIATADRTGRRLWVYPAQPKGRLYRARSLVALGLLAFLFAAPFIRVNGEPWMLFDIINRHFIIFGLAFRPQDLYLFVLAVLTVVVFILQFTAIFGRLFCGWVCPQTVFLEMVFRRIEYWIDGGPARQRQLREGPWTGVKIYKWLLKHAIFFSLSFVIGNLLLSYVIGVDELHRIVAEPVSQHLVGLTAVLIFTFLFYGVFAWFREQACTIVCPYGRLQSVLIDSSSIVVAYDPNRGEPRAPMRRGEDRTGKGDCVECGACEKVCPTGIDIRNGTQLECVNCTACIDACNRVMRRVGRPEGLIRYTSDDRLAGRKGFRLTGRVIVYSSALVVLITLLSVLMLSRTDVETTILRTPGTMFYETDDGQVRNLYSVKLVNQTHRRQTVHLRLKRPEGGTLSMMKGDIVLEPQGIGETVFFIDLPREKLSNRSSSAVVEIIQGGRAIDEITTTFMGPDPGSNK